MLQSHVERILVDLPRSEHFNVEGPRSKLRDVATYSELVQKCSVKSSKPGSSKVGCENRRGKKLTRRLCVSKEIVRGAKEGNRDVPNGAEDTPSIRREKMIVAYNEYDPFH